jgi:hypothetical protein
VEWVVREGVEAGGEMTQALYAHMNNKTKQNKTKKNTNNNKCWQGCGGKGALLQGW